MNQEYVRGPYFSTCITTTVFTVFFLGFFFLTLLTWVIQTYVFNIYEIEIPFVWVSYSEDAILGIWVQTYQKFCTNLLIIYFAVFAIFTLFTGALTLGYFGAEKPSKDDKTSFWAVVLRMNFNVLFRLYWILVYPVQVCIVLVIFGSTDIQFLVIALLLALTAISFYNLADWRMSKPFKESGSTLCIDFNCCTDLTPAGKLKHVPFYALIEFWIFFIFALIYVVLLFILVLVYTLVSAENHFYYLWAVFAFELIQLVAITVILTMKNEFLSFFAQQNLALSSDVALFIINSVVFLLNALVICIVSWARIGYIGCSNGCATSCP